MTRVGMSALFERQVQCLSMDECQLSQRHMNLHSDHWVVRATNIPWVCRQLPFLSSSFLLYLP